MKEIDLVNSKLKTLVDDDVFEEQKQYKWLLSSSINI